VNFKPDAALRKDAEGMEPSPSSRLFSCHRPALSIPGQTVGQRLSPSPAGGQVAGLPGAQAAPPAGVLGDGTVPTPAAARSSGMSPGAKKDAAIRGLVASCRWLRELGYSRSTLLRMVKAVWNQQNREASQGLSFSPASPPIGDYEAVRR